MLRSFTTGTSRIGWAAPVRRKRSSSTPSMPRSRPWRASATTASRRSPIPGSSGTTCAAADRVTVAASPGARAILVLLLATAVVREAAADENGDLNLIPDAVNTPASPAAAETGTRRVYLENAFTGTVRRDGLAVPFPPPDPPTGRSGCSSMRAPNGNLGSDLELTFSDRFNLSAQEGRPVQDRDTAINDFREGYLGWRPFEGGYLDLGRINLKSGVALGYNPTDFFKTRAVVEPLSADPSVLREDRLGTLMVAGNTSGAAAP